MCTSSRLRPDTLAKGSGRDAELLELLKKLSVRDQDPFSRDLQLWLSNDESDVTVDRCRGWAMLSVSGGGLREFEYDGEFKSYSDLNHMFADLLGPLKKQVTVPIVF